MKVSISSIAFLAAIFISPGAVLASDAFADREELPSLSAFRLDGTTYHATSELGDPHTHLHSVWYRWTPLTSGRVSISTLGNGLVAVHVGDDLLTGQYIAPKSSGASAVKFYAIAGQSYNLCVWSSGPNGGPFTLGLVNDGSVSSLTDFVFPLSNDDFESPLQVIGSDARFVQYTRGATLEPFEKELQHAKRLPAIPNVGGVWVEWTAPKTGTAFLAARSIYLRDVFLLVGRGDSIEGFYVKATGRNILRFKCNRGVTYRFYVLSPYDNQVLSRIVVR